MQLVVFLAILSSCTDEDKEAESQIIGSWQALSIDHLNCENEADNDSELLGCTKTRCLTLEISDDYTYRIENIDGLKSVETGDWTIKDGKLTFSYLDEDELISYTMSFERQFNNLTLTRRLETSSCNEVTVYQLQEEEVSN